MLHIAACLEIPLIEDGELPTIRDSQNLVDEETTCRQNYADILSMTKENLEENRKVLVILCR